MANRSMHGGQNLYLLFCYSTFICREKRPDLELSGIIHRGILLVGTEEAK